MKHKLLFAALILMCLTACKNEPATQTGKEPEETEPNLLEKYWDNDNVHILYIASHKSEKNKTEFFTKDSKAGRWGMTYEIEGFDEYEEGYEYLIFAEVREKQITWYYRDYYVWLETICKTKRDSGYINEY